MAEAVPVVHSCHELQICVGVLDCLVAAIALRLELPVLARDRDFDAIASISQSA